MNNVSSITQKFDRDVDGVLTWMHEKDAVPAPLVIVHPATRQVETDLLPAFDAMLPGPATPMDAIPETPPVVAKCWSSITWAFVVGVTTGTAYMIVLDRWFS